MWYVSFFTGIVAIISLYYAMQLKNIMLKVTSIIAFSLLLMGETIDLLANIALNNILLFFVEMLEMFITVGFFSLIYYTYLQLSEKEKVKKKRKKGRKK